MMTPATAAHGIISGTIFAALNAFVEAGQLGYCFPGNTGFLRRRSALSRHATSTPTCTVLPATPA